jgi:predicted amidophosphoribosyltransferase
LTPRTGTPSEQPSTRTPPAFTERRIKPYAKKFFRGPGLVVVVVTAALATWFAVSFLTPEPVHKDNPGSINYNGVAEVMDIAETQTKCFVYIKRDTGQETKQSMRKGDCRKIREGDMINIENGQYVSTASSSYK